MSNNYRKPNRIYFTTWSNEQVIYSWDKNTKNFVPAPVDCQEEINKFNGQDLKSFLNKNIIPEITGQSPAYIDETQFSNSHLASVYNALNTQIVESGEHMENLAAAQALNNAVVEENSKVENSQIQEDNYINIKVNKLTGEVIK